MKIGFSGHETFVCRTFWLKKGYDYVMEGRSFSQEDAVVRLGVGKNMVTSISFWMRGFHILDREQHQITQLGNFLFEARDPFLEDIGSLWLLHYSAIKNEKLFIFNSFFNEFSKERSEFTKEHLISFMKRKTEAEELRLFSDKTYDSDANVLLRTYLRSNDGKADLEDETANLLVELNLLSDFYKENADGKLVQWYRISRQTRYDLPGAILLFAILDRFGEEGQTISFGDLLEAPNSPGVIFRMSEKGLEEQLRELANQYDGDITFSETAGNQVLQFRNHLDKWQILEEYYA
jgi:hypothetical protein